MTNIQTERLSESHRRVNAGATKDSRQESSGNSPDDRASAAGAGQRSTPIIALVVAVAAAVLALIAVADDDVASTPAPSPTAVVEDPGPPTAGPVGVPDGAPCPNTPARGMVPC